MMLLPEVVVYRIKRMIHLTQYKQIQLIHTTMVSDNFVHNNIWSGDFL